MNTRRLPKLTYHTCKSIEDVVALRKAFGNNAVILAGGTDVIPLLKRRNMAPRHVINIKAVQGLQQMTYDEKKGLGIGAALTLREVAEDRMVMESYPLLAKAAQSVAYNQIRNMATLVGNVCVDNKCPYFNQSQFWWQSRADCFKRGGDRCYVVKGGKQCYALSVGDTVSALISLDAELAIAGPEGNRRVRVEEFYSGDGRKPHRLGENELVTAAHVPPPSKAWHEGFMKKSVRGSVDFAIATLSVRLKNNGDGLEDARIAMNGVSSKPIRALETERFIVGKGLDLETIKGALPLLLKEISPLSQIGAPVMVRRQMIKAMFEDLIESIQGRLRP